MATVRKWEGRLIVTGDTTNISPFFPHMEALAFTQEQALALARDLRDAADPWDHEKCREWLCHNADKVTMIWRQGRLDAIHVEPGRWQNSVATAIGLRECVHRIAKQRGIDCPLGDMCAICHPPAPPVPSDEDLAKMGTEELIGWIKSNGYGAYYTNCNAFPWSATRNHPRASLESATLLGLAKIVAMQLREASA